MNRRKGGSPAISRRFLQWAEVAAVPGTAFGDSGEGHLRISYAYSLDNLKRAMERLKTFVERLRNQA